MNPLEATLSAGLLVIAGLMLLLWVVGLFRRDVSIVDVFWGSGFAILAWLSVEMNRPATPRTMLLAVLTTIWGGRLTLHLFVRKRGHAEDHRYAAMRAHHHRRFWWVSLFTVFLLQGLILWVVAMPLEVAAALRSDRPWGALDAIGACLWGVGFFFESAGDLQLARFKADLNNDGRVMDCGLWRYTRHPNYFGDFCVWWGLYLIAAAGDAGWTIVSPALMSVLLLRVSGVTLLETTIVDRRPGYAEYQRRTNAFFPGPRKKS